MLDNRLFIQYTWGVIWNIFFVICKEFRKVFLYLTDKGKFVERRRRKATGPTRTKNFIKDSRVAEYGNSAFLLLKKEAKN